MSQPHLIYDVLRVVTAASALWLSLLILRLGWRRTRHPGEFPGAPHFAAYLSYVLGLIVIAVFRAASIGDPPDKRMWIAAVIVGLGMYGILRRVRFTPPGKR